MTTIRSIPCTACPYRQDCPSGLWATQEYEKLRAYDAPTSAQPIAAFACHATPEHLCHGWAVVHGRERGYELLALRFLRWDGEIPEEVVPLFASGDEAATHGQRDIDDPSPEAVERIAKLLRKYPRLARRERA